ncbi:signal peptidase I [Altericroceibacterium endophyticum]|uniref:Signal peptidase I n=1 Tax=Altericroceibacterium endophyticum TaxID=1808508 RepID=A0A6I4T3C8_9SPHN|nr:signal peptidase I [Altericroceibacterium endophyticum]MXO64759.1 signal peptidase I [Altericroceibacterium endophyticum]
MDTSSGDTGKSGQADKEEGSFFAFLLKLVLVVAIFRSFIFSPFNIPSESMMPRLLEGDYLLAAKWPYGYSKYSLPFSVPLIPGRIMKSQPERGDVVIFKAPPLKTQDYVKRVIGLPGDQIQVLDGIVHINGEAVSHEQIADLLFTPPPEKDCVAPQFAEIGDAGRLQCRYPQFRETLPNGVSYTVLDMGTTPQDTTDVVVVPRGHMFVMGDNRDNSMDSRFPAIPGKGVGIVPQDNLVARATIIMWSTDGTAEWLKPWTWFTAARWNRIGDII